MNPVLELLVTIFVILKSIVTSLFFWVFPQKKKCVKNEKVLITGAGSGLGRLMCNEFSKRGAVVIACDINPATNEETAEMIRQKGGKVHTYTCDVRLVQFQW